MLAYYTKRSRGEEFEILKRPVTSGMWLDGSNLSQQEIDILIAEYNLERNIVYDVRDRQELPRIEKSNDDLYVFLRMPWLAKSGHVATLPMLVIMRTNMLLSLTTGDGLSLETISKTTVPTTTEHTDDLLLGMIAACISLYEELLHHTERSINDTTNRLRTHEVTNADFIHFVVVEDNLNSFRMNLKGILNVIERLRDGDVKGISQKNHEPLDDIALQIKQLLAAVDSYSSRVESVRNAYGTIANNKLNQRMKTLTVLTVLITLPNVIFGMFGMNIVIPYTKEPWAYMAVMGMSVASIIFVYVLARKFKVF